MVGEISFNAEGETTGELKGDPEVATVIGVVREVADAVVDVEEEGKSAGDVTFSSNRREKDVDEVSCSSWSRADGADVSGLSISISVGKSFSAETILGQSKSSKISLLGVEATSDS